MCLDGTSDMTPGAWQTISVAQGWKHCCNIELQKASVGKSFEIKSINYDLQQIGRIRPDAAKILDNVVYRFNDNPGLELEMGLTQMPEEMMTII
ncbi:MAG: hypothetical protein IPK61_08145 [Saprospiraceae bacterium]|nr:hypothetical protein [Saprospiraceae bacterium]